MSDNKAEQVAWAALTEEQRQGLKDIRAGLSPEFSHIWSELFAMGLVEDRITKEGCVREMATDLGNEVLAQAATTTDAVAAKPGVITASLWWIVCADVAFGGCKVTNQLGQVIEDISPRNELGYYDVSKWDGSKYIVTDDPKFTVTWTLPSPAQPAAVGGEAIDVLADFFEYGDRAHTTQAQASDAVNELRQQLATATAELDAARLRESGLRVACAPLVQVAKETREDRYSVYDTLSVSVMYEWLAKLEGIIK